MAPIEIRTLVSCCMHKRKMTFVLAVLDMPINLLHIATIIYEYITLSEKTPFGTKDGNMLAVGLAYLMLMAVFQILIAIGHMYYWKHKVGEKYMLRFWLLCSGKILTVRMILIPFLSQSALGLAVNLGWLVFKFYQLIIMTMYSQGRYISNYGRSSTVIENVESRQVEKDCRGARLSNLSTTIAPSL